MVLYQAILPRRATSITAPGSIPESMCCCVMASIRASWLDESPTSSGVGAIGKMDSARAPALPESTNRTNRLAARLQWIIGFPIFCPAVSPTGAVQGKLSAA